ncbi:tail fiber assembly protein [Xenorhabdus sp. TH1]|uniref:tail fiber assembly protein n=1 Tax=Xenorhabdus sp. TH1 TaxID=3130166 RepID=UPI0030D18B3F
MSDAVRISRIINGKSLTGDVDIDFRDIFDTAIDLGGQNLNDLNIAGLYYQSASSPDLVHLNYPVGHARSLAVIKTGRHSVKQTYTEWLGSNTYIRVYNGSSGQWSVWSELYTTTSKPTAADLRLYSRAEIDDITSQISSLGVKQQWVDVTANENLISVTKTQQAKSQKKYLMIQATDAIAPLQYAVDLQMATNTEQSKLTEWKRYYLLLNRVDCSTAPNID